MIEHPSKFSVKEKASMTETLDQQSFTNTEFNERKEVYHTWLLQFLAEQFFTSLNGVLDIENKYQKNQAVTAGQLAFYKTRAHAKLNPLNKAHYDAVVDMVKANTRTNESSVATVVEKMATKALSYCLAYSDMLFKSGVNISETGKQQIIAAVRQGQPFSQYQVIREKLHDTLSRHLPNHDATDIVVCEEQFAKPFAMPKPIIADLD